MSEATRARKLFLQNVLEELRSRHGDPEAWPMPDWLDHHPNDNPSWGPVGSLAQRTLSEFDYQTVLRHTEELNQMEWSARLAREAHSQPAQPPPPAEDPQPAIEEPAPQNRVLGAAEAMQKLDRYGETSLFACPVCGEESAKASVPLDLWHCTACKTSGKASRLVPRGPLRVWERT